MRVYGKDHVVTGNYMQGLTGDTWNAGLTITNGDATNSSTNYSAHFLPENVQITGNTLIDCKSGIEIGYTNNGKYSKKPVNCLISGNTLVRSPITIHTAMSDNQVKMVDNIITDEDIQTPVINEQLQPEPVATRVLRDGRVMLRVMRNGRAHYISISGQILFVE